MIRRSLLNGGLIAVVVVAGCSGGGGPGSSGSSDSADGSSIRQPSLPAESDRDRLRAELAAAEAAFERAVSDDRTLGYTTGRYERRRVEDGEETAQRGSYFTVWRRQPDGSWLVEADMGTEPSSQPD